MAVVGGRNMFMFIVISVYALVGCISDNEVVCLVVFVLTLRTSHITFAWRNVLQATLTIQSIPLWTNWIVSSWTFVGIKKSALLTKDLT
jgi:hypothetical protein